MPFVLEASPAQVKERDAPLEVTVSWTLAGDGEPSSSDYVACYNSAELADPDASYVTYEYASGEPSGSVTLDLTGQLTANTCYMFKYIKADGEADGMGGACMCFPGGGGGGGADGAGGGEVPINRVRAAFEADDLAEAAKAAQALMMEATQDPSFVTGNLEAYASLLEFGATLALGEAPAMAPDSPEVKRKDAIQQLMTPLWGALAASPEVKARMVPVAVAYLQLDGVDMFAQTFGGMLSQIVMSDAPAVMEHAEQLFALFRQGKQITLFATLGSAYSSAKEVFQANVEVPVAVLRDDPMMGPMGANVLWEIAKDRPELVAPHLDVLLAKMDQPLTATMSFMVLGAIAETAADELYAHFEQIQAAFASRLGEDSPPYWPFAQIAAAIGKTRPDEMLPVLGDVASQPALQGDQKAAVLEFVLALGRAGNVDQLAPFIPLCGELAPQGGKLADVCEKIVAVFEGRDVEGLTLRAEAMEARIAELNGQVAATCHNMDDVKAYCEANVNEIKDFIGDVVKKLPQPSSMSVADAGMLRKKKVRLHFVCCYCEGQEFTTETAEWGKWMKGAISLVGVGKCLVQGGGPLELASAGFGALRGMYAAYKSDDAEDFDAFVTQPFLTSEEQDRLIDQLRAGQPCFFDHFEYAARAGGWACAGCMEANSGGAVLAAASGAAAGAAASGSGETAIVAGASAEARAAAAAAGGSGFGSGLAAAAAAGPRVPDGPAYAAPDLSAFSAADEGVPGFLAKLALEGRDAKADADALMIHVAHLEHAAKAAALAEHGETLVKLVPVVSARDPEAALRVANGFAALVGHDVSYYASHVELFGASVLEVVTQQEPSQERALVAQALTVSIAGQLLQTQANLAPAYAALLQWPFREARAMAVMALGNMVLTKGAHLSPHVDVILEQLTAGGQSRLLKLLPALHKYHADKVEAELDTVMRIAAEEPDQACFVYPTLSNIARTPAGAAKLVPFLPQLVEICADAGQQGVQVFGALSSVVAAAPDAAFPYALLIAEAAECVDLQGQPHYYNVLGALGALSAEHAAVALRLLFDRLARPGLDPQDAWTGLSEVKALVFMRRHLLLPEYVAVVGMWCSSAGLAAGVAEDVLAHFERRDAASLAVRVEDMEERVSALNSTISDACANFDEVEAYMQAHMEEVKEHIASIVKKLPQPSTLTIDGTVRKALRLHFQCCRGDAGCEFPESATFQAVSHDWNKWLKIGFTLLSAGKAVLDVGMGNPLGLVGTAKDMVKGIYSAYNEDPAADFDAFFNEPFLTSEEQDRLLDQLSSSNFFAAFDYSAQDGNWACHSCMAASAAASAAGGESKTPEQQQQQPRRQRRFSVAAPGDGEAVAVMGAPVQLPELIQPSTAPPAVELPDMPVPSAEGAETGADPVGELGLQPAAIREAPEAVLAAMDRILATLASEAVPGELRREVAERLSQNFLWSGLDDEARKAFGARYARPLTGLACAMMRSEDEAAQEAAGMVAGMAKSLVGIDQEHPDAADVGLAVVVALAALPAGQTGGARAQLVADVWGQIGHRMTSSKPAIRSALPSIFDLLQREPAVVDALWSPVSSLSMKLPRLLKPYVRTVLALASSGDDEWVKRASGVVPQVYPFDREAFENPAALQLIVRIIRGMKQNERAHLCGALYTMSKRDAAPLVPLTDDVAQLMQETPIARYVLLQVLANIALQDAAPVAPHLAAIEEVSASTANTGHFVATIWAALGRADAAVAAEMLGKLAALIEGEASLGSPNAIMALTEMRGLALALPRELLEPHMELVRRAKREGVSRAAEAAGDMIAFYEGRDAAALVQKLDALDQQCADLNDSVGDMCSNFDEVEAYIKQQMAEVKQFLGQVCKALPAPVRFSVEGRVRKSILLHFACGREKSVCVYPRGREFQTETKEWSKWLKMGVALVNAGQAVLETAADPGIEAAAGAAGAFRAVYDAYKERDDADFDTFTQSPFLMSADRDKLLAQLQKGEFFEIFAYDAQIEGGGWVCPRCRAGDQVTAEGILEAKAAAPEAATVEGAAALEAAAEEEKKADEAFEAFPPAPSHAGSLVKRSANRRKWARRHAVLVGSTLAVYKGPRAAAPLASWSITGGSEVSTAPSGVSRPNCVQIKTDSLHTLVFQAGSAAQADEWADALRGAVAWAGAVSGAAPQFQRAGQLSVQLRRGFFVFKKLRWVECAAELGETALALYTRTADGEKRVACRVELNDAIDVSAAADEVTVTANTLNKRVQHRFLARDGEDAAAWRDAISANMDLMARTGLLRITSNGGMLTKAAKAGMKAAGVHLVGSD